MKNIINNLIIIALCTIVVIASVIVGTPLKENTRIISIITLAIFLLYIILYKFVLKNKFNKILDNINKLDIFVGILCFCPIIPIIAKTCVNFEDSVNLFIRYIAVFAIYLLSRILFIENLKYKEYVKTTIIITGIISAIIGIDNMTNKFFVDILYDMGVPFIINIENRMFGNFGYANTFAISLLIPFILSFVRYMENRKKDIFYVGINFIFLSCIILSYSKAVCILTIFLMILYILLKKDKNDKLKIICNFTILCIFAIIYVKIFSNFLNQKKYLGIWLLLVECMSICIAFTLIFNKYIYTKNINLKIYAVIFGICIILVVIFIIVGLNLKKPLVIFQNRNQTEEVKYKISNIAPNEEYKFMFNVEAKSLYNKSIYRIKIIEEDKHYQTIKEHEIKINTFLGEKNIEFTTTPDTVEFALVFESKNIGEQLGFKVNEMRINDEEYILNYLYLPSNLVNKIKNFSFSSLSVSERTTIYNDAFKLIKKNPWTGIGGNGWVYKFKEVASYEYGATQVHSYPIQLFLEYGILSFLSYIVIVCYIIIYSIKNKINIEIILSITAILLHSTIDFNLSFMNMLIYTFLLISIISSSERKDYND